MNQTWFLRAPVGNHKLVNFMQSMVKSADLPSDGKPEANQHFSTKSTLPEAT